MEFNAEQMIVDAIRGGLRSALEDRMKRSYDNPFDKLLTQCIEKESESIRGIVSKAIQGCINDPEFSEDMRRQLRSVLAKTLVQRFGGELEKAVNALKSDPTTRARITLAIEEIVRTSKG